MRAVSNGRGRGAAGAEAAIAAVVLLLPLCLGGAPPWALWPFALLSGAAILFATAAARASGRNLRIPPLTWAFALSAAITALQLVPLPPALLDSVSPAGAEVRSFALVPLGFDGWRPVSLDVPGTMRALALELGAIALLVASAQVSASRSARRRLLWAVVCSGALVAVIGLVHRALDATALFGWYRFHSATPPLLTPFGNPNHLAGFLVLSAPVALGLALRTESRRQRQLAAAACVTMGVACALSLSRAGMACGVFGLALTAALWALGRAPGAPSRARSHPRDWARRWEPWLWALGALFASALMAAVYASERIGAELATADSVDKLRATKVELWPELFRAALQFWPAGMGRGAFAEAFPRFQHGLSEYLLTHPENLVLQQWCELGLLFGTAVLALGGWALWRMRREALDSRLSGAALAGVTALLLHNLFDFSLELPACLAAWVVVAGALSAPRETGSERQSMPVEARWGALIPAGAALAVVLLALAPPTARQDEEAVEALLQTGAPATDVRARALEAIRRHPADFALYRSVALAEAPSHPADALAFLNRALFLRPLDPGSHRAAARALLRLGHRGQAFVEYRLAAHGLESAPTLVEALSAARTDAELRAAVGPEQILDAADWLARAGRSREALVVLRGAVSDPVDGLGAENSHDPQPGAKLWIRISQLELSQRHLSEALDAAVHAQQLAPGSTDAVLAHARVLRAQEKPTEAANLLRQQIVARPEEVELSFELVDLLLRVQEPRLANEAVERVSPFIQGPTDRSRLFELKARIAEALGHPSLAIDAYRSAARLQPQAAGYHYEIARLYESLRKPAEALQALREGEQLQGDDARQAHADWAQRLEAQARQQTFDDARKLDAARRAEERFNEPDGEQHLER